MDTPTTVPELRRLLDAKKEVAVNNGECRDCIDLDTVADSACDACSEAARAFDNALTDDTIAALIAVAEAANAMRQLSYLGDEWTGGSAVKAALAPLFPKEDDCE